MKRAGSNTEEAMAPVVQLKSCLLLELTSIQLTSSLVRANKFTVLQ